MSWSPGVGVDTSIGLSVEYKEPAIVAAGPGRGDCADVVILHGITRAYVFHPLQLGTQPVQDAGERQ